MVSNGLCHEIKNFLLFTQSFKNTTLLEKSDDCLDVRVSLKFCFPSTLKRKAGVFEITHFEERFPNVFGGQSGFHVLKKNCYHKIRHHRHRLRGRRHHYHHHRHHFRQIYYHY